MSRIRAVCGRMCPPGFGWPVELLYVVAPKQHSNLSVQGKALIMTHGFRFAAFGGPDVLEWTEVEPGPLQPSQVRVRHSAIGLNMIDTYYRSGLYTLELPSGLGCEAAGVVAEVGSDVTGLVPGNRVAYAAPPPLDAYAEERLIDARWLVKLPDEISELDAAAMMLKGLTAWYLLFRSYRVAPGDFVLFHAAAGGVGLIACQWAKHLGARVIGVVGDERKRQLALANGCEHVLLSSENVPERVRELTGGEGVPVVYDSVGRDTFMTSLDCLRPHGCLVSFGNTSGPVDPVSPMELARRGSLYLTRPMLFDFIAVRSELETGSAALFDVVMNGAVRIQVHQRYALVHASAAHRDLEKRRTTGSTLLLP
jgi:NADPH:quinone reductase